MNCSILKRISATQVWRLLSFVLHKDWKREEADRLALSKACQLARSISFVNPQRCYRCLHFDFCMCSDSSCISTRHIWQWHQLTDLTLGKVDNVLVEPTSSRGLFVASHPRLFFHSYRSTVTNMSAMVETQPEALDQQDWRPCVPAVSTQISNMSYICVALLKG